MSAPTVAFQGETGAFSEEAARAFFRAAAMLPQVSFEDVFEAVASGGADYAVVPIENSLFGSVSINYDLLYAHDVVILGELRLRIRHHLMALPGGALAAVEKVLSHPQALGQCQAFLRRQLGHARIAPAYDTAGAAKMVRESGEPGWAAIASKEAARRYGLEILAAGIETDTANYTRFLALARPGAHAPELTAGAETPYKTSIVYAMRENAPGVLFKSLAAFALRDLDLLKIESRPLVGRPGAYLFHLDLEGAAGNPVVQRALDHLREMTDFIKVLGSYPEGPTIE